MKKSIFGLALFLLLFVLSACGATGLQGLTGSQAPSVSVEDVPEELPKEELKNNIEEATGGAIEAIISNNFHLLDVISTDEGTANVYATSRFTVQEIVDLISQTLQPEEISEFKDNQQILVYPDDFVTFKLSDEDQETVLIEVASDQFVRNNYSPNYLNSFFTFMMLNRMLDTTNWSQTRTSQCRNGDCYGGYSTNKSSAKRGMSTYRGGGPSAGK